MALTPKTAFLSGNEDGTPLTGGSGTYGPIRLTTIMRLLNSISVLQSITDTAPPGSAAEGMSYYVAATATGAWAGQDGKIALRTDTGWEFFDPVPGIAYGNATTGQIYSYDGSGMNPVAGGSGSGAGLSAVATGDTLSGDGVAVGSALQVVPQEALDDVPDASPAEIAALAADDEVAVRINGDWRKVNISDLPVSGGLTLGGRAVGNCVLKTMGATLGSGNGNATAFSTSLSVFPTLDSSKAHIVVITGSYGFLATNPVVDIPDNSYRYAAFGDNSPTSSGGGGSYHQIPAGQSFRVMIEDGNPGPGQVYVEIYEVP